MSRWEHFVIDAVIAQHPALSAVDVPWLMGDDGAFSMDENQWPKSLGVLDMPALQVAAEALSRRVTQADVNVEILENLKLIWGGETEARVAQHHQNAVGVMGRLVNKIVSEEGTLTADEEAIKDGIKAQLQAHEAVLFEGRRIKAGSPIADNYSELLAAIPKP